MKHKIMGVPIKKSTMPDFCKVAAEDLALREMKTLDVVNGEWDPVMNSLMSYTVNIQISRLSQKTWVTYSIVFSN